MPSVRRNEPITAWREGDFVQGFALVTRKEVRQDRNGREYMDLELSDGTSAISAKVWPDSDALRGRFEDRQFVAFKGTVRAFKDAFQLIVDHCRPATERDRAEGFDPAALVPTTPEDVDDLWRRLNAVFPGTIGRASLRRLVEAALARHGAELREHPAAKSVHHAYRGGLLEHVVAMAELAGRTCDQYPDVDRDLVLVGVLFHDLGKLRELGPMPVNDYTLPGQLVGHVVLGRDLLLELTAGIDGFPADLRLHLEHLVLSHQGRREYGSPVEPMTPEALVLHFLDDLDSKLSQLRTARRQGGPLQFLRPFGRTVYLETPPRDPPPVVPPPAP